MKKSNGAVASFFRRNLTYIVLFLCILAVGASIALILISENEPLKVEETIANETPIDNTDDNGENEPEPTGNPEVPTVKTVSFILPVENYTTVCLYTDALAFNQSLNRYSSHKAIDFMGEEGTKVFCVYDGVIKSVENSLLTGVTVTIDHGDGLYTVYNSVLDGEKVTVGQAVKQGDVIGVISTTNRQEYKDGAHLHFETIENGVSINPEKYLTLDNK